MTLFWEQVPLSAGSENCCLALDRRFLCCGQQLWVLLMRSTSWLFRGFLLAFLIVFRKRPCLRQAAGTSPTSVTLCIPSIFSWRCWVAQKKMWSVQDVCSDSNSSCVIRGTRCTTDSWCFSWLSLCSILWERCMAFWFASHGWQSAGGRTLNQEGSPGSFCHLSFLLSAYPGQSMHFMNLSDQTGLRWKLGGWSRNTLPLMGRILDPGFSVFLVSSCSCLPCPVVYWLLFPSAACPVYS